MRMHYVALGMLDVEKIDVFENHVFVNTGTAHHVELVKNLERYPVVSTGGNYVMNFMVRKGVISIL